MCYIQDRLRLSVTYGGDFVSEINLMAGKNNMDILKPYYEKENVKENIKASETQSRDDEKLTLAGRTKTNYLELAIGEREKELEKLGLLENEDGKVLLKQKGIVDENGKVLVEDKEEKDSIDGECETCANRKYQDGSDEMVSFKSATHISPDAAATAVRAHEGEHVSNAYDKAAKNDGEVVNASVAIHTSVCPECGRTYVSGGTTTTTIRYNNDNYAKNAKEQDATVIPGKEIDALL